MEKKIAFISTMSGSPWGGSEELWVETAMTALEAGHAIFVSVFDWGALPVKVQLLQEKGAVLYLRKKNANYGASLPLKLIRKIKSKIVKADELSSYLIKFSPDVILISQGGTYDLLYQEEVIRLIRGHSIPYHILCHFNWETGVLSDAERRGARNIFDHAENVFFVSSRNRDTCRRQLAYPLRNSSIVANPIHLSDYTMLSFPSSSIVNFASVARLDCAYKGQDILLEALSNEVWRDRDWILNLYGTGKDKDFLTELAHYFTIHDKVVFHNHISDIREIWKSNHILLMPSVGEGTPLSLIEAMICGRPAVATDVGGNGEYVKNEVTGFLAENASSYYFGMALERAWKAKDNWELLGKNAHKMASERLEPMAGDVLMRRILSDL